MDQELCMRIADIRRRLDTAALERWGRVPEIIAVSKTVAAPRVNEIKASGILHLGENRVQEILEKLPYLDASFQIDLIGRLQINKVKYIIDKVKLIHSVESVKLAEEIDKQAKKHGVTCATARSSHAGTDSGQYRQRASKGRRCRGKPDVLRTICCRFAWP